jgi:hypothetical protein
MSLRDDIHGGADVLRAIVRKRTSKRSSLTWLVKQTGIPRTRLIAFVQGRSSLTGSELQRLNSHVLRGRAEYQPDGDRLTPLHRVRSYDGRT